MKNVLILILLGFASSAFSQNDPPVAVDDTLYFRFGQAHKYDSLLIWRNQILENDSDPNGNNIYIDSLIYTGNNTFVANGSGAIYNFYFKFPSNYFGSETFSYIIKDNGNPVKRDTGQVTIVVMQSEYDDLNINNISARVHSDALFAGSNHDTPGFEVPVGSGVHSIFRADLWVAGTNNGSVFSNVRWFSNSIDDNGNSGPVSYNSHTDSLINTKWDRVWTVYQHEIEYHVAYWNTSNYNPPPVFLTWPAHGDTTNGEAFYLAPFIDYNNDGLYNPYDGDYPKIKGDESIYFIYNDGFSPFSLHPLISEVHGLAYSFSCPDSALQNTIFVDYRIINRSNLTYDSTYFGMWVDGNLGDPNDDRIQSDVDRGLFYQFNGRDIDPSGIYNKGYGNYPPAQAVMILQGAKQNNDGIDNDFGIGLNQTVNGNGFGDGVVDNEYWGMEYFLHFWGGASSMGYPRVESDFYNFLQSKLRDGLKLDYGGYGLVNSSTATGVSARYFTPDSSDSYNYGTNGIPMPPWNELTAQMPYSDRRGVSSTGPVTFAPGDEIDITYAFVFGRDYDNTGAQAGVTNMLERADSIRSYFDQGMLSACGFPLSVKNHSVLTIDLVIYPNPTTSIVHIRQEKAMQITVEILDLSGKALRTVNSKNQLTRIDLSGLANGIYLVKVSSVLGIHVEKVIKE